MPNKKINELPADISLSGDQLVAVGDPGSGLLQKITIAEFNGIKKYAVTTDADILIPGKKFLETIMIESDEDFDLVIGKTPAGNEISGTDPIPITADNDEPAIVTSKYYNNADSIIYLTGITGNCVLTFIFKIF